MKKRHSLISMAFVAAMTAAWGTVTVSAASVPPPPMEPASHSSAIRGQDCLAAVVEDLKKGWPDNSAVNIVAFGHSVPAGYGDAPTVHKRDAYPRLLEDALVEAYPTAVLNVITAAVGGDNSTRGLVRLQREVLDFHPRSVSIDFGMNDLVIPLTEARANLTSIVEQIRNVGACPVLVTPTWYVGADEPDNAKNLKAQVAMIRDLGAALDVPVADAQKAFADFPGDKASLMATSNHPNRKGHELIAGQLVPIFVPAISAGPTR